MAPVKRLLRPRGSAPRHGPSRSPTTVFILSNAFLKTQLLMACWPAASERVVARPGDIDLGMIRRIPGPYGTHSQEGYRSSRCTTGSHQGQGLPINTPHYPPANKQTIPTLRDHKRLFVVFVWLLFSSSQTRGVLGCFSTWSLTTTPPCEWRPLRWSQRLALSGVWSVQSLERLANVEELPFPLVNTAPVVNIVIF